MEHYTGIDVSLELSSVCVVDAQGKIVKEAHPTAPGSNAGITVAIGSWYDLRLRADPRSC
jgi:hypothetical protein